MPYRICKTIEIENGHLLTKHPDKCRFPHGHSRKVECVLEADELDANEMVCDFKVVRDVIGEFLDRFDHALCVNTDDPGFGDLKARYGERIIGFPSQDPTTEVLARTIFDELRRRLREYGESSAPPRRHPLRPSVRVVRVRVWETSSSWAEYEADDDPPAGG